MVFLVLITPVCQQQYDISETFVIALIWLVDAFRPSGKPEPLI